MKAMVISTAPVVVQMVTAKWALKLSQTEDPVHQIAEMWEIQTNGIKVDQEIIVQDLVVVSVARMEMDNRADSEVQIVSATKADSRDQIRSAAKADSGDKMALEVVKTALVVVSVARVGLDNRADSEVQIVSAAKADSGDKTALEVVKMVSEMVKTALEVVKTALEAVKMVLVSMAIGQPINSQTTTMEMSSVQMAISGADQMETIGGKVVIDAVTTSMAMGETETIEETHDTTNTNGTIVLRSS